MPGRLQQRRASADADPYTAIHTSGCMIYTAPAPHSSKEATTLKTGDRGESHSRENSNPDASNIRQRVQLSGRTVPPRRDPCHEDGMPLDMVDNATTRDLALALLRRKRIRIEILRVQCTLHALTPANACSCQAVQCLYDATHATRMSC